MRMSMPNLRYSMILVSFLCLTNLFAQTNFPVIEDFQLNNGGWTTSGENSSWEYGLITDVDNGWVTNLDGNYNNDEESYLISPIYDFSSLEEDPYLGFELSVNLQYVYDYSSLEFSVDGGSTFSILTDSKLSYTSDNNWTGITSIDVNYLQLTDLAGESEVQFRFSLNTDGSGVRSGLILDNWYILDELPDHDIGLEALALPNFSSLFTTTEAITVDVANYGFSEELTVPLNITIDGPDGSVVYGETASVSLQSNEVVSYDVLQAIDLSTPGNYTVTVTATTAEDFDFNNNTIVGTINSIASYSGTLPYIENFEGLVGTSYNGLQGVIEGA